MFGFFIAHGPAFKKGGLVDSFPSVDIYPLMCHILDIKPNSNNGTMAIVSMLLRTSPSSWKVFVLGKYVIIYQRYTHFPVSVFEKLNAQDLSNLKAAYWSYQIRTTPEVRVLTYSIVHRLRDHCNHSLKPVS